MSGATIARVCGVMFASTDAGSRQKVSAVMSAKTGIAFQTRIAVALDMGGTITGEHGIGQYKLRWLSLEQPEPIRELQRRLKELFDPAGILNPGKAI